MNNLQIFKEVDGDNFFLRNKYKYVKKTIEKKIENLIQENKIKVNSILEIGCANGNKLNQYSRICKSKKNFGIDLSKKAIADGKKRYKNLNLLNISSLEIDKLNLNFNLIICGFFLYNLDRKLIFKQFDLIHNKIIKDGYLLIYDFDPLFKHSNKNTHSKNLISFKMSYDNFLLESGLFEIVYKIKYKLNSTDKTKFKSDDVSLTLFKKIDFKKKYPENV